MTTVLVPVLAAVLLSPFLPRIELDTIFADMVVRLTDTATWTQLALVAVAAVAMLITRSGIGNKRRGTEAGVLAVVMLVALVGNALLNERIIKPFFEIPRPNIVELAEAGSLGPTIPDAAAFYASGDEEARRDVLREQLPKVQEPALSDLVEAHWIHETGYSFPSGHTTAAMTFITLMAALGFLWLDGRRKALATWAAPVWAVAVAYSRPLLEVHTAADVIAGTVAGICWGLLAAAVAQFTIERFSATS
jgi:phosphatidylglycerophosphatase B